MSLFPDFVQFLACLNARRAETLLVGGYALAFHGWPRFTPALDLWVRPERPNAERVLTALGDLGCSRIGFGVSDFITKGRVVQVGVSPLRIDLVTQVDGVEFKAAWARSVEHQVSGQNLHVIALEDLLENKRKTARPQDLVDVAAIEAYLKKLRISPMN
jgi:hypothetical protein